MKDKNSKSAVLEAPLYQDPFRPVLLDSPVLHTSPEQERYIKDILDICCSDSAFAKKAYAALQYILTAAPALAPVLSGLTPNTTTVDVPVSVSVAGTGFVDSSVIKVDGSSVVTNFVSDVELTFSPIVANEGVQVITVVNPDLLSSESMDFTVTPVLRTVEVKEKKPVVISKVEEVKPFIHTEQKGQEKK